MNQKEQFEARPYGPISKGIGFPVISALIASLAAVWIVVCGAVFLMQPLPGFSGVLVYSAAAILPAAILGVCLMMLHFSRVLEQDAKRLHITVEALRQSFIDHKKTAAQASGEASLIRKLNEIAEEQRKIYGLLSSMPDAKTAVSEPAPAVANGSIPQENSSNQTVLELGTPIETLNAPLSNADFIRALNFPETPEDTVGFAVMNRALKDHLTSQMIRAAQDILTLLSQDGIYMDDLRPDMARPDVWRQFANGERGRSIAALGGIHDRSSLALSNGRIKQDPVFRDTTHHFLRVFDKCFSKFESTASDAEISAFSETRTARAFMLLGRVAGTFS